jgi:hypothetical protein
VKEAQLAGETMQEKLVLVRADSGRIKEVLVSTKAANQAMQEEIESAQEKLDSVQQSMKTNERILSTTMDQLQQKDEQLDRALDKLEIMRPVYLEHLRIQESAKQLGSEGDPCFFGGGCGTGLMCWARRCVPSSKIGEECYRDDDCESGAFCLGGYKRMKCSTGKAGESCGYDRDCVSKRCRSNRCSSR